MMGWLMRALERPAVMVPPRFDRGDLVAARTEWSDGTMWRVHDFEMFGEHQLLSFRPGGKCVHPADCFVLVLPAPRPAYTFWLGKDGDA